MHEKAGCCRPFLFCEALLARFDKQGDGKRKQQQCRRFGYRRRKFHDNTAGRNAGYVTGARFWSRVTCEKHYGRVLICRDGVTIGEVIDAIGKGKD